MFYIMLMATTKELLPIEYFRWIRADGGGDEGRRCGLSSCSGEVGTRDVQGIYPM